MHKLWQRFTRRSHESSPRLIPSDKTHFNEHTVGTDAATDSQTQTGNLDDDFDWDFDTDEFDMDERRERRFAI